MPQNPKTNTPYVDPTNEPYRGKIFKKILESLLSKIGYRCLSRGSDRKIKSALDAMLKFISGIVHRWITYHHLSPCHGFLYQQADYPTLVYDLMKPYRGELKKIAFQALQTLKDPYATTPLQ